MRQSLIAANWKMNGSRESVRELLTALVGFSREQSGGWSADVVICPPSPFLQDVEEMLKGSAISMGAQNINANASGAFTGEVSTTMVMEFGCQYAIVGHSERRTLYGETDSEVAEKFSACIDSGLTPILCVGETGAEREQGLTVEVVSRQVRAVIDHAGIASIGKGLIAYEPVWAIGTGLSATADQAEEVHRQIRSLVEEGDSAIAAGIRILYGGSVTGTNAAELFGQPDIDGALVGGASLKAAEFAQICSSAG